VCAALREAQAKVRELDADLAFKELDLARQSQLSEAGITSRQNLDQARAQAELARARRDAATAVAQRLEVTLARLRIAAPFTGVVLARLAQPGETVAPGAPLIRMARIDRLRIEEIDEFDLSRIHLDCLVRIRAEGPDGVWRGHLAELPNNLVGRKLKPEDPARPSDTRVLMVKVALDEATPLRLGQRVELDIGPPSANLAGANTPAR
jgi:multidrug efflux pump subunit AcrA (membrane-fusion protein)